jgi:peptidoglycan hydrolase-like protein with peptidoglycan-binding domain
MIKRTLGLVVCVTAAVGIAGCASNSSPPPAPAPAPAPVAAPAPTPPPPPAMPSGLSSAQQRVAKLQMALNANGAQLTVDGKSGPATTDALKSYQSQHQLKPTGHVDSATMKALGL